jgi:hypothetical protein
MPCTGLLLQAVDRNSIGLHNTLSIMSNGRMIFKKKVGHSATTWQEIYPELVIVGNLDSDISVETIQGYPATLVSV